ncbi:MAG: dynamin family protein [Methyloprofundus sp.]|nr:dynamin family protein [Methyloprofundus sp.]
MNAEKLQQSLATLDEVFSKFDDIVDVKAREIKSTHCSYTSVQVRDHVASLKNTSRLLKVGIIGRVKAGKSSLINSLLFDGKDILPKAATPMTAALTTIKHSDEFKAEVEFLDQNDVHKLEELSERYSVELAKAIDHEVTQLLDRENSRLPHGAPLKTAQDVRERAERAAKIKFDQGALTLKSAYDQIGRIQESTVNVSTLPQSKVLDANSAEDLSLQLHDYVGSSGQYMPFTRTLHISMPVEGLSDIEVIDTPGLNDAVASREQRTYEMLKECNVVFIVSPAGQFLHAQDLDLANRLSKREGVQEIYIVASQVDTQLHSSERKKYDGRLPDVINGVSGILEDQALKALTSQENEVLSDIAQQQGRLFVTSGICQTLLAQPESLWDQNAAHALSLLKRSYPNYFETQEDQTRYLNLLAGRDRLLSVISNVRTQKESILIKQLDDFVNAQANSLEESINKLTKHFDGVIEEIETADIAVAAEKLKQLQNVREKGSRAANLTFVDYVEELESRVVTDLENKIRALQKELSSEMNSAEGTGTETIQVKKDGLLSGIARLFGGGYRDEQVTFNTFQAGSARRAIEEARAQIEQELRTILYASLNSWRKQLTSQLVAKLRETIGDKNVDADQLTVISKSAIKNMRQLPDPTISDLPASLVKSGVLRGYEADEYLREANTYSQTLVADARGYLGVMKQAISELEKFDMGEKLFSSLEVEMSQFKNMVENKKVTIDKLQLFKTKLSELK